MISIVTWKFVVCIAAAVIIGAVLGWRIKKPEKPTSAGVIDFEKGDDGREKCVFKLEGDVEWIATQKTIVFEVRHGGK